MEKHPIAGAKTASVKHEEETVWTAQDSADLYGVKEWGAGYFNISEQGDAVVTAQFAEHEVSVPIIDIVRGMSERGLAMPAVLRVENILDHRIKELNEAFARAVEQAGYQSPSRGVFPVKVNERCDVIDELADFGGRYDHGFEAGSKAE